MIEVDLHLQEWLQSLQESRTQHLKHLWVGDLVVLGEAPQSLNYFGYDVILRVGVG